MNKPSFFTTPSGDVMVVLPRVDYEHLLDAADEAADIRVHDEVRRAIASGEEELIPAEYVNRILSGEHPVRVWREFRGLSGRDLAQQARVSQPYLSQIETGQRDGTFETMKRIAIALRVTLDDLSGVQSPLD